MPNKLAVLVVVVLAGALLGGACAGGGAKPSPTATLGPGLVPLPLTTGTPIGPPLEGPPRGPAASVRTNYRDLAEFQLPAPQSLPEPPDSVTGQEFRPPAEPQCPEDWQELPRQTEGFKICHPETWSIQGRGYVSAGFEDRWYSLGLYLFEDGFHSAHVSIYVVNPYAKPFTYTRDCEQAYRVTFAGEAASLCPDHPGEFPEAKIIAYHVRKGDLDYFVNVVLMFPWDAETGSYQDTWDPDVEAAAIAIAQTFQLTERITPPTQ